MLKSDPLYRLAFDAATLLRNHPTRFQHPHKEMLFGMAYPPGSAAARNALSANWSIVACCWVTGGE
jgi:hypothetical protein